MVLPATTTGGWAVAIARALEYYGIDGKPLFEQAGIDLDASWDPNTRYPVVELSRLTRLAADASKDPAFGITVGRMMRPGSWHALGFAVYASRTLREVFERFARYLPVFTTCGTIRFEEEDGYFTVIPQALPAYIPIVQDEDYEALMATLVSTLRHLKPGGFAPNVIRLPRKQPPDVMDRFERMFRCPIEFGAPVMSMTVDVATIDTPLPTANPEIAQRNDEICAEYIARLNRSDIITQVYSRLIKDLPDGEPSMEDIAEALHLSSRSLQRKLKEQGTSYKQLLDGVRRELALQYLRQSHLTIGEISYMLGFAHVSNFSRAFRRWTGTAPADFRSES